MSDLILPPTFLCKEVVGYLTKVVQTVSHSLTHSVCPKRSYRALAAKNCRIGKEVHPKASLNIADSSEAEYCSNFIFLSVRMSVTGMASQLF